MSNERKDFIPIHNIDTYEGTIPEGYNLVVYDERAPEATMFILYGFDEVEEMKRPGMGFGFYGQSQNNA